MFVYVPVHQCCGFVEVFFGCQTKRGRRKFVKVLKKGRGLLLFFCAGCAVFMCGVATDLSRLSSPVLSWCLGWNSFLHA